MAVQLHRRFRLGEFEFEPETCLLLRGGEQVHLPELPLRVLLHLIEHRDRYVTRQEMLDRFWEGHDSNEEALTKCVSTIRSQLGDPPNTPRFIETRKKVGYRFVGPVEELTGGAGPFEIERMRGARIVIEEDDAPPAAQGEAHVAGKTVLPAMATRDSPPVRPRRFSRAAAPILVCAVLALAAGALLTRRLLLPPPSSRPATIRSVAVLPLKDLSGDPAQEYFADGMTEALINELAKVGALHVISRTSAMQYKGARKSMPEIARELNVDAVVEGSVLRSDGRVRVTAQLIRAATDQHLWAGSYERDLRDVLALQGEVARGITDEIRVKLTPQEHARLTNARPVNPVAHEAYLKGLYYFNQAINTSKRGDREGPHRKSFEYFEQAIKIEPEYALAYADLARSYHWLASIGFPHFYPKAKEAALKALALDDTLAEAHGALAFTIWVYDWDFAGAEREFKRTIELNPSLGNVGQHGYALFLSNMGRHDEAIREMKLAQDLDPLTLPIKINLGGVYLNARQYDQAAAQFQHALELDPDNPAARFGLSTAYLYKGMYEESAAEYRRAVELAGDILPHRQKADSALGHAIAGRRAEALRLLDELKDLPNQQQVHPGMLARIYGALGDRDQAMTQLEKAYAERRPIILGIRVMPEFDSLRSDPRFADLLRRVGL